MIEKLIKNYLESETGKKCYLEEPEDISGSFIVIEKTGSEMRDFLYASTFAVRVYDGSMLKASTLNETAKTAMLEMANEDEICKVSLNSDYPYADTEKKNYRYQTVFDIVHY